MLTFLIAAAGATTWERMPALPEVAARSTSVVRGLVLDATSEATAEGLVTTYTIDVEATLAGRPLDELIVRLPGGHTPDGWSQVFSGIPLWEIGDEVLVFLGPDGRPSRSGLFQVRDGALVDALGRFGGRTVLEADVRDWLSPRP